MTRTVLGSTPVLVWCHLNVHPPSIRVALPSDLVTFPLTRRVPVTFLSDFLLALWATLVWVVSLRRFQFYNYYYSRDSAAASAMQHVAFCVPERARFSL